MWRVNQSTNALTMTQGDYGVELPVTITGAELTESDRLDFVILSGMQGTEIVKKTYDDLTSGDFAIALTAQQSAALPCGRYVYRIDWYRNGTFMDNIVQSAPFVVEAKA